MSERASETRQPPGRRLWAAQGLEEGGVVLEEFGEVLIVCRGFARLLLRENDGANVRSRLPTHFAGNKGAVRRLARGEPAGAAQYSRAHTDTARVHIEPEKDERVWLSACRDT